MDIFLSKQDPRELPKGTRDPLGFETIWTNYGRSVIKGLTTITNSIEEFLTALLGFYMADKKTVDDREYESRFLRFEQVAGYLRGYANKQMHGNPGGYVRGITRVQERLKDLNSENNTITISSDNAQILSNQSAYGLWGLYSTALDSIGLIKSRKVQETGASIVNEMAIPEELASFLSNVIDQDATKITLQDLKSYSQSFVDLLGKHTQQKLLQILLQQNDVTQELLEALQNYFGNSDNHDPIEVVNALMQNVPLSLREKLGSIRNIDGVLSAMNWLFDGLRIPEQKERELHKAVEHLSRDVQWRQLTIPEEETSDQLNAFVDAWNRNDLVSAGSLVLTRHKNIMKKRDSAPWVEVENNKLKIRVEHHQQPVYSPEKFSYSYFLDSYIRLMEAYMKVGKA